MITEQARRERRFLARMFERDEIRDVPPRSWRMEWLLVGAIALLVAALTLGAT